jgi:hypothetical protein
MIKKVISGFQDGADIAGIHFAKSVGLQTGGHIPFGYRTLSGPKPEYEIEFGAIQDNSPDYPPRTERNVQNADATARFAFDFETSGEKCTIRFIKRLKKPYIDIPLAELNKHNLDEYLETFNQFIVNNNVEILNVAGNAPHRVYPKPYEYTLKFLTRWYEKYYPSPKRQD